MRVRTWSAVVSSVKAWSAVVSSVQYGTGMLLYKCSGPPQEGWWCYACQDVVSSSQQCQDVVSSSQQCPVWYWDAAI